MVVSGCQFVNSGTAISAGGESHIVGNSFFSNTTTLVEGSTNLWIENNQGLNTSAYLTAPAMVSNGGTYVYGGNFPAKVYITGGTGLTVFFNGQPVAQNTDVVIDVKKLDQIGIQYTAAPTWRWVRV